MAGKQTAGLLLVIFMIAGVSRICSAATHIVGGSTGWTIPPSPNTYSTWASGQTFAVGDVLVFNFATRTHTVAEVNRANFNGCGTSNTIGAVHSSGPANITLTTAGTHYFICTITGHCLANQRLAVTVTGPSSASPTPSPSSSPAPSGGAAAPTVEGPSGATTPAGGPSMPTTEGPTTHAAEGPTGSSPSGSFAASTGVSLLSLASVGVAALMF